MIIKIHPRRLTQSSWIKLVVIGIALISGLILSKNVFARPVALPTAFLYPPFYGRASEESIFDHSSPTYSTTDNKIVTFLGETITKACPHPTPDGTPPPNGLCDYGYGAYWSYLLGAYTFYNGHDGIDYGISYRPVLAAGDASQVVYAGWYNPQDHRSNLGIYVRLQHPQGFDTWYGHMSALAVQSCSPSGCASIQHGDVIGISGTTGNSSGPHLHFRVTNAQAKPIDPYGWAGQAGQDPWPYDQADSLWAQFPNISGSPTNVYPSGQSLTEPASANGYVVDDLDARFDQIPANCWNVINTSAANSQNGRMLAIQPVTDGVDTCQARWKLPSGLSAGIYAVSARIPVIHATSQGAIYTIQHDGRSDVRLINQAVFPNPVTPNGWVFIGNYYFNANSLEYVRLGNNTQDEASALAGLELAADAVRFVPILTGTAVPSETATITLTPSITPSPSLTLTPSITPTATLTLTASITLTPTVTQTPTITRTPTLTKTSTLTQTPTKTPIIKPSSTRWPTATPPYTLINVYFVNYSRLTHGQTPYEVSRSRYLNSSLDLPRAALDQYFKGPGTTERYTYGDIPILDGYTGYSKFEFADGLAKVYLVGKCKRQYPNYTLAQLLFANLKQFPQIKTVKIFDATGQTQNPDGPNDSLPVCLETNFTPTPTPSASLTIPAGTSTRTQTPGLPTFTATTAAPPTQTRTPAPASLTPAIATRWPSLTPRATDTRWPTLASRP